MFRSLRLDPVVFFVIVTCKKFRCNSKYLIKSNNKLIYIINYNLKNKIIATV